MRLLKKVVAILLLTFGVPFSIWGMTELLNPQTSPKDRQGAMAALVIFTLPSTAIGTWLLWGLHRQKRQESSKQLQNIFVRLLKEGDGQITMMNFALEAQVTGPVAKQFLDEKAKEFDATFGVDEAGVVTYQFPIGGLTRES